MLDAVKSLPLDYQIVILEAEIARLRRIEAMAEQITADSLSPWGASAYEEDWLCDYCAGRCDDMGDEPGDWGHTVDCPWMTLRRELHPASVDTAQRQER